MDVGSLSRRTLIIGDLLMVILKNIIFFNLIGGGLDDRRATANKGMEKLSMVDVSLDAIFNVLSIEPVLNKKTTYTTMMSAAQGNYTTLVRHITKK